jgi:hypothetical protein
MVIVVGIVLSWHSAVSALLLMVVVGVLLPERPSCSGAPGPELAERCSCAAALLHVC